MGGDVLCIAEAFLLAQYSDYAYHNVYACIDKFVEKSARGELFNPPGYLHRAIELTRRDAETQVGLQADFADRQSSTRPNIYMIIKICERKLGGLITELLIRRGTPPRFKNHQAPNTG